MTTGLRTSRKEIDPEVCDVNKSTGLVGVWKDKFAEGTPTYKLLSDGTAQYVKEDGDAGTSSTSGFGTWELSANGQVRVSCQVKKGCTTEADAASGQEEHVLAMHCMMFEGVFKRQKELNERDEERVRMLAEGLAVPPLHPLSVIDADGDEKTYELFDDEKLSDLKGRAGLDTNDKMKVMYGDKEITEGEPMCKLVPAKGVLRILLPEPALAITEAASTSPKDIISEAFRKWDVTNAGVISEQALGRILVALGVPEEDIPTIFSHADAKKGGHVDYGEFINWIYSSAKENDKPAEYQELYKEKIEIVKWMFPHVSQTLILDMLVESNGERNKVTQALQKREDDLAVKFGSQANSLIEKVPSAQKAAALEALNASGGDEAAALKALQEMTFFNV